MLNSALIETLFNLKVYLDSASHGSKAQPQRIKARSSVIETNDKLINSQLKFFN